MLSVYCGFGNDMVATSLMLTRVTIVLVCFGGLYVLATLLVNQSRNKMKRIVPRPVVVFTVAMLVALAMITTWLLLQDCSYVPRSALLLAYGTALVWSLAGMTWIVYLGFRRRQFEDMAREEFSAVVLNESLAANATRFAKSVNNAMDDAQRPEDIAGGR